MAYGRISKKQQEILDYIKNEILNRGFPPAVREICETEVSRIRKYSLIQISKELQ